MGGFLLKACAAAADTQGRRPIKGRWRMAYQFSKVTNGVYALAVWDETWNSYNNCYLVLRRDGAIMIDAGTPEHIGMLTKALATLGLSLDDVAVLIATHGHRDHVGGSLAFETATKLIHSADWELLPAELQAIFSATLPEAATHYDLDCVWLGHHTEGSVALFDRSSGVLFIGDHLAFFGDPLPKDGLVSEAPELRELAYRFVAQLAQDPTERERYRFEPFDRFVEGLVSLSRYSGASTWCTGHGAIVQGDITGFIDKLLECATEH